MWTLLHKDRSDSEDEKKLHTLGSSGSHGDAGTDDFSKPKVVEYVDSLDMFVVV